MSDEPQKPDERAVIAALLHSPVSILVRGIVGVYPQFNSENLLIAMARTFGKILGIIYGGAPVEITKLREACADEFRMAIHGVPITELPKPAAPPPEPVKGTADDASAPAKTETFGQKESAA